MVLERKHYVTKRPKRVTVRYVKVESYIAEYACPACCVIFKGCGPSKNTTRFICTCGQELIVI